jgi:hypothetical protein
MGCSLDSGLDRPRDLCHPSSGERLAYQTWGCLAGSGVSRMNPSQDSGERFPPVCRLIPLIVAETVFFMHFFRTSTGML